MLKDSWDKKTLASCQANRAFIINHIQSGLNSKRKYNHPILLGQSLPSIGVKRK